MTKLVSRIGAVLYVVWGLLQLNAANKVYELAWARRGMARRCSTPLWVLLILALGCSNKDQRQSTSERLAAIEELSQIRPASRDVIDGLVEALWDTDYSVRSAAREAVVEIGLVAVPALAEAIESSYQKAAVAYEAEYPIKLIGNKIDALIKQLESPDDSVRTTAARSLADTLPKARKAYQSWLRLIDSETPKVREYITVSLYGFWERVWEAHSLLAEALKDENQDIRDFAAIALREIEGQARTTAGKLTEALDDQDRDVRRGAARTLKKIDDKIGPVEE